MTGQEHKTILIGAGNPFRSDDAAGRAVVRRLRGEIPPQIKVLEETGDGAELLEAWEGAECVILVDAVQSGAPPGTIHRIDAKIEKLPGWFSHASTHTFGVAEAIELARTLGELPEHLVVYGIEGLDFSAGTQLSPEVAAVIGSAAKMISQELLHVPAVKSPPRA